MKKYFYVDANTSFWEKEIEEAEYKRLFSGSATASRTPAEVDAAIWSIDDPEDMGPDADDAALELVQIGGRWYSTDDKPGRLVYA